MKLFRNETAAAHPSMVDGWMVREAGGRSPVFSHSIPHYVHSFVEYALLKSYKHLFSEQINI